MAKQDTRSDYKGFLTTVAATLQRFPVGPSGVGFWSDELSRVVNRQLGKLSTVDSAPVGLDAAGEKLRIERDAAVAALAAYRRGGREVAREAKGGEREAWDRCAALEAENARLRAQLEDAAPWDCDAPLPSDDGWPCDGGAESAHWV